MVMRAHLRYTGVAAWLPTRTPQPSPSGCYGSVSRTLAPTDTMRSSTNGDRTEREGRTYGYRTELPRWTATCLGSHRHIQGSLRSHRTGYCAGCHTGYEHLELQGQRAGAGRYAVPA